jgi:hypothetical protein
MMCKRRNALFGLVLVLYTVTLCLGAQSVRAQGGCGPAGIYAHVVVHFAPDKPLVWVRQGTVAATLCTDETAVGGGHITFILKNNFVNADPVFILTAGTEMTFWYAPIHWIDSGLVEPIVYAALQPTGKFRDDLLDILGSDALADWESYLSSPFGTGGYDLDNDGNMDVRVTLN